ncbi:PLDc N-terminal domain-containing protein [Aquipuribacter hungaricus]|uniref:PLDc N-terminal domain-containing protein n=1 Tax=Aquipuribacter hungaricus TaxID=545624 RepID=A0ABV7WKB1_9MICO
MLRLLVVLAVVGLHVYALVDCMRTQPSLVRGLPFAAWVLLVLFLPVVGPLLWLWAGRPGADDPAVRRR